MPQLPPGKPQGCLSVSVLIPARNEAATLPHLLSALKRQSLTPLEVIVIDDHSSDRTAAIALEAGVTVHHPAPCPWVGAARPGRCSEPGPEFLERMLASLQELGGLVSVQPFQRTEKPYVQLAVLFNLVGLMAVPLQLLVITRRVGRFGWINLVFPIPVLFFLAVFILAILNLERGSVTWKGRQFTTRG